jgi:DNA-binding IclR family transcriptional regulator
MGYTVDAVDKALSLLFLVADQPGLGVTELAKRAGITKARSYRLLETLEKSGLIRRHGSAAIYSHSFMSLFIGASAQEQIKLVRLAKQYLGEVGSHINEHVYVQVRDGLEAICIAHWDCRQMVRVHTKIGVRKPLYVGASGKLLAAFATSDVQDRVLQEEKCRFTKNTITDRDLLEKEFERIRIQGHSVSRGERVIDTVAVAVPIRDAFGAVVATLSVAIPASRSVDDRLDTHLCVLKNTAAAFSRDLGYDGDDET